MGTPMILSLALSMAIDVTPAMILTNKEGHPPLPIHSLDVTPAVILTVTLTMALVLTRTVTETVPLTLIRS